MAIEIPDEHGLSSDSLRGSHQFVRPDLVDSQDSKDPLTGRPNGREKLSANEVLALEQVGILVDENGYEREPEPTPQVAPVPTVTPRVRSQDRAPAVDVPASKADDVDVVPVEEPSIPPYGGAEATNPVVSANPPVPPSKS